MDWESQLTAFADGWRSTRRDTREMLACLDDRTLPFHPPGATWKPLYWQFGCIGRTQHVYTQALLSGRLDFALFAAATLPAHDTYRRHAELCRFLETEDEQWLAALQTHATDPAGVVQWPTGPLPVVQHIALLQEHERLHHGQFIAYFTLAGIALPVSFRADWSL